MMKRRVYPLLATGAALATSVWFALRPGVDPQERLDSTAPTEALVETFVLTPIRIDTVGMEVPAQVLGPLTNNSCRDWKGRSEACYLPSRLMTQTARPSWEPLAALLERHLSAALSTWKVGVWPVAGNGISFDLRQYASLEHLWLTTRIRIDQDIGFCWLSPEADPVVSIARAADEPAATLAIEVYDGTRNAQGYPHKSSF